MGEAGDLDVRIDRLCSRASEAQPADGLLSEMEDLLAVGYLEALTEEARSRRLGERLEQRVEHLDEGEAALEIRKVALQKRGVDAKVSILRERLAVMRERFMQLRSVSRST